MFEFADLFFGIQQQIKMSFNGLRLEYALEGNSNYIAWKEKIKEFLDEKILKAFIDTNIP